MNTSYFGNRAAAQNPKAVSIARFTPRWWGPGRRYSALAPSADLLKRAKMALPWPKYVEEYTLTVLTNLDPHKVYEDLSESIICCWEKPGENCHRHLVAEWIKSSLGIEILEL